MPRQRDKLTGVNDVAADLLQPGTSAIRRARAFDQVRKGGRVFLLSKLTVLAFAGASAFVGAALYINAVEQPTRLALGSRAMLKEWIRSNRRGFVLLSILAIASALLAYAEFGHTGDVRFLFGATIMAATLPYEYFVVVPVNVWLCAAPPATPPSILRDLMSKWGLAEWGQTVIGLAACGMLGWAIAEPA